MNTENSQLNFDKKIDSIALALSESKRHPLVDNHLDVIFKYGFKWFLLCLLRPFYALFKKDVFSHVRVNNVAQGILTYCENNKHFLNSTNVTKIRQKIITPLNAKTKYKNDLCLKTVSENIQKLIAPPVIVEEPTPLYATRTKAELHREPILSEYPPPGPIVDTTSPIPWKWPINPNLFKLSPSKKMIIDQVLREIIPLLYNDPNLSISTQPVVNEAGKLVGKILYIISTNPTTKESTIFKTFELPTPFIFININNNKFDVFIISKEFLNNEGTPREQLCYNLISGEYYIRKKLVSVGDQYVAFDVSGKNQRGINEHFVENGTIGDNKRYFSYQPRNHRKLKDLLGTTAISSFQNKLSLVGDIIHALDYLHAFRVNIDDEDGKKLNVGGFLQNIDPTNIKLKKENSSELWKCHISNFDFFFDLSSINRPTFFTAPEYINFCMEKKLFTEITPEISTADIKELQLNYGQPADVWSAGLVLTTILMGYVNHFPPIGREVHFPVPRYEVPSFNSLMSHLSNLSYHELYPYEILLKLDQASILRDLQKLEESSLNTQLNVKEKKVLKRIWFLIRSMLSIKPEERPKASQVLSIYTDIVKKFETITED